jgi:hypothetical protein
MVVELIEAGCHKTQEGLVRLVEIAQEMNTRKLRPELLRILRDHTPDIREADDDMVPTAWRHAGTTAQVVRSANPAE